MFSKEEAVVQLEIPTEQFHNDNQTAFVYSELWTLIP